MPSCAVICCRNVNKNTKGTDIKYFSFPKNEDMSKQWIAACTRSDKVNLKNACICSIHFAPNCFEIPLRQKMLQYTPKNSRHLKSDAVPTLNLLIDFDTAHQVKNKKRPLSPIERNEYEPESNDEEFEQKINLIESDLLQSEIEANSNYYEKQKIQILEAQNRELLKKVDELNNSVKKYEMLLATIFTQEELGILISSETTE